ncbi:MULTISPECIES: LCP family protein [unclassified Nocardioides]|uniref:LCP family protein n=1 Tax=unclassified Nocardioides TaxID=2615069 RepID=UPI000056FA34|nr:MULTISPECIES: LCP family protein [unclassified Nocardioides]ABL80909.1 cell envelope-related transcriptional attenuator [Nocardioides sp. JS614]
MTDRPRGDGEPGDGSPDFHWLYGGSEDPGREPRPDETRVLPTVPRPGETRPPAPGRPATQPGRPTPPTGPPTGPPPGGRPRGRRRGPGFWLRIVVALLVLWVVYLVAVPLWAWSKVDKVDFEPSGDRPGDQPGTTYLLVGSDSRAGLSPEERKQLGTGNAAGQRTDTIMLLHTGDGPNLLMSIPRDSLVEIPGHGTTKINAAYAYGGPKLLVKTIEQNTGIRVDDYVEIGLGGLAGVVDAVGGITICPKQDMVDKLANLDVKKGCQEADGTTALGYARSRHTSNIGDIDRVKRQREVVAAVGDEVVSPWTVLNPVRYWRLSNAVPDFFAFGEGTSPVRAAMWASSMTHVNGENGLSCVVPIADLAVHWDAERSQQMFRYIIEDRTDAIPASLCTPTGLPKSVTG